ncbi:MAG: hypothetical protein AB7U23_14735 [Dehalococcoidia bacterium]
MTPPADDTPAAVLAIRSTLHTNRHARLFFDMLVGELGEAAHVETANGGKMLHLFRRAADGWIVPWPLVSMSLTGRLGIVIPLAGPMADPEPRPGPTPKLRGLGPGEIKLHDGPWSVTVTYRDTGVWMETTRGGPVTVHEDVVAAMDRGDGSPVERLVRYVAGLDVARHGAARVLLPEQIPQGAAGSWLIARRALSESLWYGELGPGPMWMAADGYSGEVRIASTSREDTLARWHAAVERVQPRPPAPQPTPDPGPDYVKHHEAGPGMFAFEARVSGPRSDLEAPQPTPANTPCALVDVPGPPSTPPPFGTWVTMLDAFGRAHHAARREEEDGGFLLAGQELLASLGAAAIEQGVADVLAKAPVHVPPPPGIERPRARYELVRVAMRDEFTLGPVAPIRSLTTLAPEYPLGNVDATVLPWAVYRLRPM